MGVNGRGRGAPFPRWDGRSAQSLDRASIDFPGADYWVQARNFLRRTERDIRFIVIHITGGPAMNEGPAINHFRSSGASAHYIVNREGSITQMVRDRDIANHVDNIHSSSNANGIGIEHVNPWNSAQRLRPTPAQYAASARLVAWLCKTYEIPADHRPQRGTPGIRGHQEEQPRTSHNCPGPGWDWDGYMRSVRLAMAQESTFEETILSLARDPFPPQIDDDGANPYGW
ncbi:MAG: peptidoglycan recognition family protein [Planctomycetota bacterium]